MTVSKSNKTLTVPLPTRCRGFAESPQVVKFYIIFNVFCSVSTNNTTKIIQLLIQLSEFLWTARRPWSSSRSPDSAMARRHQETLQPRCGSQ